MQSDTQSIELIFEANDCSRIKGKLEKEEVEFLDSLVEDLESGEELTRLQRMRLGRMQERIDSMWLTKRREEIRND